VLPTVDLGRRIGEEVVRLLASDPELSPSDVAFLCETHAEGLAGVRVIETAGHTGRHIFSGFKAEQRVRKRRFWPEAPGVKGCTVHSFKGWETCALAMGIGTQGYSRRLAYVSMTRAKGGADGRAPRVTVVNTDPALVAFGERFEQWAAPSAPERIA
jgi:hypothetical protein